MGQRRGSTTITDGVAHLEEIQIEMAAEPILGACANARNARGARHVA